MRSEVTKLSSSRIVQWGWLITTIAVALWQLSSLNDPLDIRGAPAALLVASGVAFFAVSREYAQMAETRELAAVEREFRLASTSHMSQIVFDKHVQFCERYLEAAQPIFNMIALGDIRQYHRLDLTQVRETRIANTLWLTFEMHENLATFESNIEHMKIYARHHLRQQDSNPDAARDSFEQLMLLMTEMTDGNYLRSEAQSLSPKSYAAMVRHLQKTLGIDRLTHMRDSVLQQSDS